jgi:hypothetical protein
VLLSIASGKRPPAAAFLSAQSAATTPQHDEQHQQGNWTASYNFMLSIYWSISAGQLRRAGSQQEQNSMRMAVLCIIRVMDQYGSQFESVPNVVRVEGRSSALP